MRFDELSQPRRKRRGMSWLLILAMLIALGGAGYMYQDQILALTPGLGGDPVADQQPPEEQPAAGPEQPAAGPEQPATEPGDDSGTGAGEEPQAVATEIPAATPEPQPEPTPLPPRPTAAPAISARATAVVNLSWSRQGAETVVTITGNGAFSDQALDVMSMSDPPRVLVRIYRITEGYSQAEIAVSSPELSKIRIGHHPEYQPPQLYVVLDLAGSAVKVTGSTIQGDTIRVRLGKGG
jgi:hypothetical protein